MVQLKNNSGKLVWIFILIACCKGFDDIENEDFPYLSILRSHSLDEITAQSKCNFYFKKIHLNE